MEVEEATKEVGARLRHLRLARGLSQEELAAKIKKTQNIISRYESGSIAMGVPELFMLAKALEIPATYFVREYEGNDGLDLVEETLHGSLMVNARLVVIRCIELQRRLLTLLQSSAEQDKRNIYTVILAEMDNVLRSYRQDLLYSVNSYLEAQSNLIEDIPNRIPRDSIELDKLKAIAEITALKLLEEGGINTKRNGIFDDASGS